MRADTSRRFRISIAVLLLAACAVPAAAQEESPQVRVARLIQRLGSSSFSERTRATRELEAMGAESREQLEEAAGSDDPEVRLRATQLLRRLKVDALWAPSLAMVDCRERPASEVLAELSEQSGNRLLAGDHYGRFEDVPVTLGVGKTAFWELLDSICRQADCHVRPHYDQRQPGLVVVSGEAGRYPLAHSGPVRAKITGARRVFIEELDHEKLESETTHTFQLNMQMMWEDRFRLIAYRSQVELIEALTDAGEAIAATQSTPGDWKTVTSTTRQVSTSIRLHPPPTSAGQLATLRLKWGLIGVGDMATAEITDLQEGAGVVQDDVQLTIEKLERRDDDRMELTLTVARDLPVPDPQAVMYQENELELVDDKGQPFRQMLNGWRPADGKLKIMVTFTPESHNSAPAALRFTYPRIRSQKDLVITFRNVPLPVARPK